MLHQIQPLASIFCLFSASVSPLKLFSVFHFRTHWLFPSFPSATDYLLFPPLSSCLLGPLFSSFHMEKNLPWCIPDESCPPVHVCIHCIPAWPLFRLHDPALEGYTPQDSETVSVPPHEIPAYNKNGHFFFPHPDKYIPVPGSADRDSKDTRTFLPWSV